jgi:hypothetical protein
MPSLWRPGAPRTMGSGGPRHLRVEHGKIAGVAPEQPPAKTRDAVEVSQKEIDGFVGTLKADAPIDFDPASPFWSGVIEHCASPDRARVCLNFLSEYLGTIDRALARHAAVLVWASATTRDHPDTEGLLAPLHGLLALKKLAAMNSSERALVENVLKSATSAGEEAVLLKTIAANAALPLESWMRELGDVAAQIRGRSLEWLIQQTTGYAIGAPLGWMQRDGEPAAVSGSPGRRQLSPVTCQLSTEELAEMDFRPGLALKIAGDPKFSGRRQLALWKQVEERVGAPATAKEGYVPQLDVMHYAPLALERAGIRDWRVIEWSALDRRQKRELLDQLETAMLAGFDAVILLTKDRPSAKKKDGPAKIGHYEAVVDVVREGNTRLWRVHDVDPKTTGEEGDRPKEGAPLRLDRAFLDGPFQTRGGTRLWLSHLFVPAAGLPQDAPGFVPSSD